MRARMGLLAIAAGVLLAAAPASARPCCGPITPDGMKLVRLLDQSGVERLWLAAEHVVWDTGEPDPARPGGTRRSTHCSAFAAAMAQRVGVYLLRPPEHGQNLLSNAQMTWLDGVAARRDGWRAVARPSDAQMAANRGELVLAVYQNPDPRRPGHIAIVRPSDKTQARLDQDGPQETQAGTKNWISIPVANGFHQHRGAWETAGAGAIRFFAHPVAWPAG